MVEGCFPPHNLPSRPWGASCPAPGPWKTCPSPKWILCCSEISNPVIGRHLDSISRHLDLISRHLALVSRHIALIRRHLALISRHLALISRRLALTLVAAYVLGSAAKRWQVAPETRRASEGSSVAHLYLPTYFQDGLDFFKMA